MKQLKQITVLTFSLLVLWAGRDAQAQTRTDEIESARAAKEANLTPEAQPRAERDIERVEDSIPYRLFTGQLNGFGLGFGTIVPGSSVALGRQALLTSGCPRFPQRILSGPDGSLAASLV